MKSEPDQRRQVRTSIGGRYVPEMLMGALDELIVESKKHPRRCPSTSRSSTTCCETYAGRPTPLTLRRAHDGRAVRRREDLPEARRPRAYRRAQDQQRARAGAAREVHGQAARHRRDRRRPARRRTATACALLGLECEVYMGAEDVRRQALNVFRMELLGATVQPRGERLADPQGRDQRGHAGLGRERRAHLLSDRLGDGAASLSEDGP